MAFDAFATLALAVAVLLLGGWLNRHVGVLAQYNIPTPITGGLLFAVLIMLARAATGLEFQFDATLRAPLLLAFFATIGLGADLKTLKRGGPKLALFLLAIAPFVVLQNAVGVAVASALDLHPVVGLIGGSITLVGGHGTGAAYAGRFADTLNLQGAIELTVTAATFGLVIGGLIGGPVAQWLMARHKLEGRAPEHHAVDPGHPETAFEAGPVAVETVIVALGAVFVSLLAGGWLDRNAQLGPVTLPAFLWCLFVGVLIRNLGALSGRLHLHQETVDLLGTVFLSLFLAMTMMGVKLWELLGLAGPLMLILFAQSAFAALYAALVSFRVMGRNYDSAVMAAGFIGFGMGATATAIANMQALTARYGPSPDAMLIVPLVGAFFIDLVNALVITGWLALPLLGGG